MRIDVEIDTTGLDVRIGSVARNLAYAVTQAINDVAGDIRTKGRGEISNLMRKVRLKGNNNYGPSAFEQATGQSVNTDEAQYLKRRFRILARASPQRGRAYAIVGWRDPAGMRVADFDAAAKAAGTTNLYHTQVGKKFVTLKELNLRSVQVTPRTTPHDHQFKGNQRTFALLQTKTFPKGAVFQRTGPGRDWIRTLVSYAQLQRERIVQRMINLPKLAERIYAEKFKLYYQRRLAGLTKSGKTPKRAA